jgi:type I restriction enzyme, S subunit
MVKDTITSKGYKQTDVGVIPVDWVLKKLGDVVRFQNGKAHEQNISEDGKYIVINSKFISTEGEVEKFSDSCLCPICHDNIVMVMSDIPNGRAIAKCFYVDKDDKYTLNQRVCSLEAKDVDSIFLFYQLNRNPYYLSFDDGVKQTNLRKEDVLSCLLKLPPTKSEQATIATALSDTDRLISVLEKLIAKKRNIKQGAMQELLTGKRRLPGFSGEWEVKKLGKIVEHIRSGIYGAEKQTSNLIPMRVATTAHINEDDTWNEKPMEVRYFSPEQIVSYTARIGDMVVVKSSGSAEKIKSGKLGFVTDDKAEKFIFSNFLMLLRPKTIIPAFLFYFLTSYSVKSKLPNLCEASTYPNLRIDEYLNIDVPYPELKEQVAIAQVLGDIDNENNLLEQKLAKYTMIKQGMMQELLTGKTRLI